jgi:hypothetical protein
VLHIEAIFQDLEYEGHLFILLAGCGIILLSASVHSILIPVVLIHIPKSYFPGLGSTYCTVRAVKRGLLGPVIELAGKEKMIITLQYSRSFPSKIPPYACRSTSAQITRVMIGHLATVYFEMLAPLLLLLYAHSTRNKQ